MYENPKFNQNNEKILCERNGKNSDMLMDIRVKILKAGETMTFCEAENETALLLMAVLFLTKKPKMQRDVLRFLTRQRQFILQGITQ